MQALLDLLKKSPLLFLLFALVMVTKVYFDKRVEGLAEEIRDVGKTSLAVKQQLREQEREELLAFREAITRWEHYLQSETTLLPKLIASDGGINNFYKRESDLYLEVNISSIRLRTLIRDEALSQRVLDIMVKLRNAYIPLVNNLVAKLFAIDEELAPIEKKLKLFLDKKPSDSSISFTQEDRLQRQTLLEKQTAAYAEFQTHIQDDYRNIAVELEALNDAINAYIYRPIAHADIDTD
jgi:hypothetical protein